jgi:hypothetical protein
VSNCSQQADDDDDDGDEEEEVEAGAGAVRFSRQGGGRGRVDLLKTQHLFGPPPLSPVHESPLEVCAGATDLMYCGFV